MEKSLKKTLNKPLQKKIIYIYENKMQFLRVVKLNEAFRSLEKKFFF